MRTREPETHAPKHSTAADEPHARRDFIRLALGALPTASLLSVACDQDFVLAPKAAAQELSTQGGVCDDEREQRTRWLQLHDAYIGRKNLRDLQGIAGSFSAEGTFIINDLPPFAGSHAIADVHRSLGMSSEPGGLQNPQVLPEREYFTNDELLIAGRLLGVHVGELFGYAPTLANVELHYASFYRFDAAGKLVSERLTINWAPLAGG